MSAMNRCETCNAETPWPSKFCSAQCEQDFWDAMGYPNDDDVFPEDEPEMTIEDLEEMNEFLNEEDEEPPYLDDYYMPYKREWIE